MFLNIQFIKMFEVLKIVASTAAIILITIAWSITGVGFEILTENNSILPMQ